MTTTLRPAGPEEDAPDGGRARRYDLYVNGRPAGGLRLVTDARFDVPGGRIEDLSVDAADRRKGRATAAVLAAEEVLRDWGCDRVEATVPAGAEGAAELAVALSFTVRGHSLRKRIDAAPPAPPRGSRLRALRAAEYPAWSARERAMYARAWAARGIAAPRAEAYAERAHRELLPDGPRTAGCALRTLVHEGTPVGTVWVALHADLPADVDGYVFSLEVLPTHRRRGHGRTLMREAERICHAAGVRVLGLHVLADNAPALRLYDALGYRRVATHVSKPLR